MNVVLVGEYLKKLRKEKSMTQEELAEELHISRQCQVVMPATT